MHALRVHEHGGPEVMRLEEVPMPEPASQEVLVKLAAASVNPIDWKIRQGLYPMKLPRTLGRDGAGVDVATGTRLLGIGSPGRDGTHAQYAVFHRSAVAPIPDECAFDEAAALGIAGLSAWIALVENAKVQAGQRVLIHAGAGGVGGFAIQMARLAGAEVWTTCSARNAAFCHALGAEKAIDYTREDFTAPGRIFDVVLDTVGGAVHARSAEVLKAGGVLAYLNAAPIEAPGRGDIQVKPTEVRATPDRLQSLVSLGLKVPIEARFALERGWEGYELSRAGHARGKIVLQIS